MKNKYLMIVLGLSPAVVLNLFILFASFFEEVGILYVLTTISIIGASPFLLLVWEREYTKSFKPQAGLGFSFLLWSCMCIINFAFIFGGCSLIEIPRLVLES